MTVWLIAIRRTKRTAARLGLGERWDRFDRSQRF
jgi:hypothetical protein